ncbi:MAG: hypothetical protein BWY99_02777 [Synergistetes bacterium ADurb.BinA166]|nr:MAG: hypothetical protein BWY99_02777 [Synergistetes bacterium ADurb.BinA166]
MVKTASSLSSEVRTKTGVLSIIAVIRALGSARIRSSRWTAPLSRRSDPSTNDV